MAKLSKPGHKRRFQKTLGQRITDKGFGVPKRLPSLFIAMPVYKGIEPFTNDCLMRTITYLGERGIRVRRFGPCGISHVERARNDCVEEFLKSDHTHLMFIDDDMLWDPESIEKMLMYDVPIVSGIVTQRFPPYKPTMYVIAKDEKMGLYTYGIKLGTFPLDEPFYFPHAGIGTAFMLVKREILMALEKPWFATPPTEKGGVRGEDFYFCMKADIAGYGILFDPTVPVYHIGICPYGLEDFIHFKQREQENEDLCQYTNLSAHGVVKFKQSFSVVDRSLIESNVPVVKQQIEEYRRQVESKSVSESCPSNEDGNPSVNKPEMKTGTEPPS